MAVKLKKSVRHGGVTVFLTVLVVAIAILANAIFSTLAGRYGWYIDMNPDLLYPVTDNCYAYLDEQVIPKAQASSQKIEIIFCNEKEEIKASDTLRFIYNTVSEMKETYPDVFDIQFLNIWEQPTVARSYDITSSSAVVVKHGDEFRTCSPRDFFVFDSNDTTTPVGYSGEKRLSIAMKAVVSKSAPACYFTLNHGESFPDDSIMHAMVDAGYSINYLDALSFDIPEDCELLITFNPTQDFTHDDGVAGFSEIDKLNDYMAKGGKYMVFTSADTFAAGSLTNLESYLSDWGVAFDHETDKDGNRFCYSIKDPNHALSVDGYTILGKIPQTGTGASYMEGIKDTVRVGNATGIAVDPAFTANGKGDHVNGSRTLTTLLTSHPGAEAWVGGRAIERTDSGYALATLTQDKAQDAHLFVCSSVEFASQAGMQTSAYDNGSFFMSALAAMGKDDTPVRLKTQPFDDSTIHIMTTAQARNVTLVLTIVPAAAALVTGLIVLIRRKFA